MGCDFSSIASRSPPVVDRNHQKNYKPPLPQNSKNTIVFLDMSAGDTRLGRFVLLILL